jgi:hypothetical protein
MLPKTKTLLACTALLAAAATLPAQDNSALVDTLLRKGILTDQEAEDLRADLAKENTAALASTSKTPNLSKLGLSGRIQAQYALLDTDIDGMDSDPARVSHAFLRRVRLGMKPVFSNGWSAYINYDFASTSFDAAYVEKIFSPAFTLTAGLKKAPIGYEEYFLSSGALKAIERSVVTRFFVESNNGRRLGAGKYRQGVWLAGKQGGFTWEAAVTNPEAVNTAGESTSTGSAANNGLAWWGNVGYALPFAETRGLFKTGLSLGVLPDQGGKTLGIGNDLVVWSAYADLRHGSLSIVGEYFGSDNDRGASATADSKSWGWWLMASWRMGALEPVVRYGFVDSDGRGVQAGDGIRSAASGGTMNELWECFAGVNWYIVGNEAKHEVKLQAGCLFGESSRTLSGAPASADVEGFRTQLQINF